VLLETSYLDDPAMTACVLCGRVGGPRADWWGDIDRRKCGPCCQFGLCMPSGAGAREGSGTYGIADELTCNAAMAEESPF
jgi:hypothetical protein